MSIADFIKDHELKKDDRLTVELEFLPGFLVTLGHLTPQEYKAILKKIEKVIYVKHVPQTITDDKKAAELLAHHVLGWSGFNRRILCRMFWLKINDLSEAEKTAEIPFTREDAEALLLKHEGFGRWVAANAVDQNNFREQLEGAEKNLPSGPDSGPSPAESPASAAEPSATS